jgi:hypothetical protein
MAQQPKKKNVTALSYSSLHEKLGESNRKVRILETELTTQKEELTRTRNSYKELFEAKQVLYKKKESLFLRTIALLVLFFVLLVFTLIK